MKKIFQILFVLMLPITAMSQFPQKQSLGDKKTLVYFKGGAGVDSAFQFLSSFQDTISVNKGFLKGGAGMIIRVADTLFMRSSDVSRWIPIGVWNNTLDTSYQLIFSPDVFQRSWVYSYTDSATGYHYYNDLIKLKGENGLANGKFWGRFDDSTGFFYPTLQRILNAYGSLDKRNVIQGNGNMLQWDSMGMLIRQRSYLSGGNDTIFSLNAGSRTTPYFIVRQSAGTEISGGSTNLNSGTLVVNDVNAQFNRPVRLGAGSEVQGIQNAIILRRSSPETPLYWIGTIITNDNTTGGVYPFPDSAGYVPLVIRFKNQTGYESDKFKFYGDGSLWIPYTPYVSAPTVDSLLAIKNGKVVKVLKSDISGGGGSPVDSTVYATLLRDMQRLDSITKYRNIPASFTSSSSITVDYISRARFIGTLSHNAAFTISNMHAGEVVFYVITGSGGPYAATFPGGFQPVLKPNTGDTTMVIGSYNGSAWYWSTNYANSPAIVSVSSSSTLSSPASLGTTVLTNCSGGAVTHTLPSASSNTGLIYRLKKTDSSGNAMSVTTTEGTQSITTQYAGLVIQSTGSAWVIIGVF